MNFPARLYHPEHGYIHVYRDKELKEWEAKGFKEAPDAPVVAERKKPGPKPKVKA